jgi:transcriptional regulator with XRE-family HTH domain
MRQVDLGAVAGLSQELISRIELGYADATSLRVLRSIAQALGATVRVELRWRGASLDRLLDEGHAVLSGVTAARLRRLGWQVEVEATYAHFGERGSIDLLAWRPPGYVLVVELKTELASIEQTFRRLDEKVRLAPLIARDRFGWTCDQVSRLVVMSEDRTSRRRVARHEAVIDAVLPMRGSSVRRWLRAPTQRMAGLLFMTPTTRAGDRSSPAQIRRVRRQRSGQLVADSRSPLHGQHPSEPPASVASLANTTPDGA